MFKRQSHIRDIHQDNRLIIIKMLFLFILLTLYGHFLTFHMSAYFSLKTIETLSRDESLIIHYTELKDDFLNI